MSLIQFIYCENISLTQVMGLFSASKPNVNSKNMSLLKYIVGHSDDYISSISEFFLSIL